MYAISVLRSHGMEASALQQVFRAVVVSKLTYATPAWWGFITSVHTFEDLCNLVDDELFSKIKTSSNHILHALLPPPSIASQNYGLRQRAHAFQLPERSTHLSGCNFLMRMLYKNSY